MKVSVIVREVLERKLGLVTKFNVVKTYTLEVEPSNVLDTFEEARKVWYEADYATSYQYDKVRSEPTAENLMGSWYRFTQLYGIALNEAGYLVGNKHWIGIGLGQWTGPRSKALLIMQKKRTKTCSPLICK